MFFDPAAGTYQTAAGFVCPFGQRQWLGFLNGVVMAVLLLSLSGLSATVFTKPAVPQIEKVARLMHVGLVDVSNVKSP